MHGNTNTRIAIALSCVKCQANTSEATFPANVNESQQAGVTLATQRKHDRYTNKLNGRLYASDEASYHQAAYVRFDYRFLPFSISQHDTTDIFPPFSAPFCSARVLYNLTSPSHSISFNLTYPFVSSEFKQITKKHANFVSCYSERKSSYKKMSVSRIALKSGNKGS